MVSRCSPWLWLGSLWLAFALPLTLCALVPDFQQLRLELELPLLWTVASVSAVHGRHSALRAGLAVASASLIIYRIDQWLCLLLMREEPLLYDQWFMARHLGVLVGDLIGPTTLLVLAGLAALGWLATRATRAALRRAEVLRSPTRWPGTLRTLGVFWVMALTLSVLWPARVGWLTVSIADNVRRSREVYARVDAVGANSPHRALMARAPRERPDVLLFIVESYGRVLSSDPRTRAEHGQLLDELTRELARAGWSACSAFATATVSGGRSWIAEGTLLSGLPIHYEAEFQHLIARRPQPPHLVGYLARHGYHTVLLAPADRDRPGARVVNRYGFHELVTHARLGYRGRPVGWGIIPDAFSLAFAERELLQRDAPVFLDFHMVTSHAPWRDVPTLDAEEPDVPALDREPKLGGTGWGKVWTALSRYERSDGRFFWMGQLDDTLRHGYQATVTYDLRLIARYLARRERDALVIVLGDHQPPVLSREDASFDAPIHVLSRSASRLAPLCTRDFAPGLQLAPDAAPALTHADLFPRLVELLQRFGP